ncbi:MAG: ATP-binding protein [Kofleriaceae bacterium]
MPWAIRTASDFERLVHLDVTTESLYLDFKTALGRGPGAQAELGRDVSQFANHLGGCLLLGVAERRDPKTALKTASAFAGVSEPDQCREVIETWIRNVLVPGDLSRTIDFVRTAHATFVAVNIPPSRRVVWVADPAQQNRLEVVRRTNHGKEYMRPGEIERLWSNTLRSAQIAFDEAYQEMRAATPAESAVEANIVGGISRIAQSLKGRVMQPMRARPSIERSDSRGFELSVPMERIYPLRVPFELLSAAWIDTNAVHLLFRAPIVFDAEQKLLQFDPFDQLKH